MMKSNKKIAIAADYQLLNQTQQGVGLIEVMIALFIFAFGSLAIGNMLAGSLSAVHFSASHLALDTISREITEHLKANSARAGLGGYNTTFVETTAAANVYDENIINSWKSRVDSLLSGETEIQCTTSNCLLSISWKEYTGTDSNEQVYNLNVPLY